MSRHNTTLKKDKVKIMDKMPHGDDGIFDPTFFADESCSKPVIGHRFANVLTLPGCRLPSADVREWVRNLEALKASHVRPADLPHFPR